MGRAPCCDKANVKKGPWSPEEDAKLKEFIEKHGTGGNWIALPKKAGLKRCGKSCRLRWLNYLRPNIKHGEFSEEEDRIICTLYANIGSRWSIIAAQLPGRTDNDIKNYWNTKLKKKKKSLGMFPYQGKTAGPLQHKYPLPPPPPPPPPPYHHHHHPQQQQQQPSSVIRPSFHDIDAQTLRNINYGTPSLTGLEAFPHSSEDVFINTSVQAPILHHHQLKDNDDSSWKNHTKSPVDYYCFGGIGAGDVGHQQTSLDDAFNSAGGFGEPMTPTLLFNSVEGSDSGGGSSLLLGRSREQAWSIDYLQSGYDQDRNKEMIPPIDGCDDNPFLDELCNMVIRGSRNFEEAQVKGTHHN